ncbi:alpha-amylase [candidate division KSB1 bacterium]|nr:alpha-amylase [candidate division KSB1 bacterium]
MTLNYPFTYEFHVSRKARDHYEFDQTIFAKSGNVVFADFSAGHLFTQKMNNKRDLITYPEQAIKASDIFAMGLIDEIMHVMLDLYKAKHPDLFARVHKTLAAVVGCEAVKKTLFKFTDLFPPVAVYRKETDVETWLSRESEKIPHQQVALEEMVMLWLSNQNPAFSAYSELFDDTLLAKNTGYGQIIRELEALFSKLPAPISSGVSGESLLDVLTAPFRAHPHSLAEQLEFIRKNWGSTLGKHLYKLLNSLDFIREETKPAFAGPAPTRVYEFDHLTPDEERFSLDADWMPRTVMIAKNTYVWLDQLSKKYNRRIEHLDQIPDAELDRLAEWGFTSLWLIGLWERSKASQRIKQMCGNPDAVASAYSLYDYVIANDLGGESAYENLKQRAAKRGIRMAGDMVPNHVGIDGKWVLEHPDWFVSLDHSPFPSYSFNGPNLSSDNRVGIYLEDHYYSRSDAAVVFKRVDHHTGSEKYIYHGNDGTSMPWNDTAQLNFLNAETREAVIQTILHVAKKFPIIRFDAAMTLAKRHIQRLWFPESGTGGDIASRAEHGMSKQAFDEAIPREFWREVVDRIAAEAPDTLLLAEAFWMLEGYFVRTLGMHRVYNSAFMNMLKKEENANYRNVIKNTIRFDPDILKRYVNFMNNPDEDTAVAQFGKDDKYFGVCVLLATMPGLSMFGHGQIEGFTEKYGMEFRRAYWDETPDQQLVERHQREIFPLLKKRYLFAHVENFIFYDFYTSDGTVNEDVFAYSNRYGDEHALVLYNNRFSEATGVIKESVPYIEKTGKEEKQQRQKSLAKALLLKEGDDTFTIFRDSISGLEYIRQNNQLCDQGLKVGLGAFKYHVFLGFRQVKDDATNRYRDLTTALNGRGVPSINEALRELMLQPLHAALKKLVNHQTMEKLDRIRNQEEKRKSTLKEITDHLFSFIEQLAEFAAPLNRDPAVVEQVGKELNIVLDQSRLLKEEPDLKGIIKERPYRYALYCLLFVRFTGKLKSESDSEALSAIWLDEFHFGKAIRTALIKTGVEENPDRLVLWIKILTRFQNWFELHSSKIEQNYLILETLLKDSDVRRFIDVNRYQDILWFHKESFETLLDGLLFSAWLHDSQQKDASDRKIHQQVIRQLKKAGEESDFRIDTLLDTVNKQTK